MTEQEKNELIEQYRPFLISLANKFDSGYTNDLIQAGIMALLDASEKFDGTKKTKFLTYIHKKIKGVMSDEIKRIKGEKTYMTSEIDCPLCIEELDWNCPECKGTGKIKHKDYEFVPLSEMDNLASLDNVEEYIIQKTENIIIKDFVETLPKIHQDIIKLIYWNGMSQMEVSLFLGISDSRVSQLHKEALRLLKEKLDV